MPFHRSLVIWTPVEMSVDIDNSEAIHLGRDGILRVSGKFKAGSFTRQDGETSINHQRPSWDLGSCAGLSVCCNLIEPGSTSNRLLTKTCSCNGDDVTLGMTAETWRVRNDRAETPAVTGSN